MSDEETPLQRHERIALDVGTKDDVQRVVEGLRAYRKLMLRLCASRYRDGFAELSGIEWELREIEESTPE